MVINGVGGGGFHNTIRLDMNKRNFLLINLKVTSAFISMQFNSMQFNSIVFSLMQLHALASDSL